MLIECIWKYGKITEAFEYCDNILYNDTITFSINIHNVKVLKELLLNDVKLGHSYVFMIYDKYAYLLISNDDDFKKLIDHIYDGYNHLNDNEKKNFINSASRIIYKLGTRVIRYFFEEQKKQKSQITDLIYENTILRNHIEYMPDGPGYKEAREHFILYQQSNNVKQ